MKRFILFVLIPLIIICAPGIINKILARNTSTFASEVTTPHPAPKDIHHPQKQISLKELEKRNNLPVKSNENGKDENVVHVIKVGSYTNRDYAESESRHLKEMGFNCYVDTVLRKGKTLHVLKIGSFTDREEAKKIQNQLRKKAPKLKAYILREKGESVKKPVSNNTVSVKPKKAVAPEKKKWVR